MPVRVKQRDPLKMKKKQIISDNNKKSKKIKASLLKKLNNLNIDISNITNYLKIKNDSVMAYLPFYGERRFGGAYNNTAGIEFEGIPNDFQINKGKKGSYEIRFSIDDKNTNTENYRVYIKLLPDMSSTININSSGRSSIQYRGNINIAGGD